LAERFSTSAFPPHLTLLPGIEGRAEDEVLWATRALAARLRPFPVRLEGVEGRDEPFRCLFVRAVPDEPLRIAHAVAARAFGRSPDPAFLPHLSLVYGTLPSRVKESLGAELGATAPVSFVAAALHVWSTEGPVGEWHELGVFGLAPT
jgi:2'-5' RNA ligase